MIRKRPAAGMRGAHKGTATNAEQGARTSGVTVLGIVAVSGRAAVPRPG